jgi:hypothetical protein
MPALADPKLHFLFWSVIRNEFPKKISFWQGERAKAL